jgi:hypothetical protein
VRGHVRDPKVLDYIIAGFDKRLHGLRIVAVLGQAGGGHRVISVSEGPERANSLADVPKRYLPSEASPVPGTIDLVVRPIGAATTSRVETYAWVAARGAGLVRLGMGLALAQL